MPRISAPTVAEHHERQRRRLLDAARSLLAETGAAPMGAVARRAGLARSSVYQYFPSADDLLAAVVADVFPDWAGQVLERVAAATTPGARVWAYVEANLDLFGSDEEALARALSRVVDPQTLTVPMKEFHARLQEPLVEALADLGEPEPQAMGEHIDALVMQAARHLDAGDEQAPPDARARALARLRRLLQGYLGLPDAAPGLLG
jgi:AcrR family transcriptional regulator